MKKISNTLLFLLIIGLLQGCEEASLTLNNNDSNKTEEIVPTPLPTDNNKTQELTFTLLQSSQHSNKGSVGKMFKLIKSQSEYEDEIAKYTTQSVPDVDFENYSVVLVDIGTRENGSYNIEIPSVYKDADENTHVVVVSKEMADKECAATAVLTEPYAFVQIPKTSHVYFDDTLKYYSCDDTKNVDTPNTQKVSDVNVELLENSDAGGLDTTHGKILKVLASQEEYNNAYLKYHVSEQAPLIDFDTYYVVLADIGFRYSIDYAISITSAYKDTQGDLHVEVLSKTGKAGTEPCAVAQAFSNPYTFVKVPKNARIYFEDLLEYYTCE